MYSKRNKILSLTLVLVISLLSLAGCKNPESPETKTDTPSLQEVVLTIDFAELGLYDFNDLSDYLESTKAKDKFFLDTNQGEYIKLFADNSLSKEISDYKTVLDSKMVVKKYDAKGTLLATFVFSEEKVVSDTQSKDSSSTVSTNDETITVTVWGNKNDQTLEDAVNAYNKSSLVYQVKIETIPEGNILGKLKQAIAKGQAPDIVYLTSGDMYLASKSDLLVDLSNYGVWELQSDFASNLYKAMTNEIEVYGIPLDAETSCLAYNLDIFNFAKIKNAPETYDELLEDAKKIIENYSDKNAPIGLFDAKDKQAVADTFISWLYRSGGTLFSEDMKSVQFNSPMGERALTLIADLYKNNYASAKWTQNEFYSGKTAFFEVSSNRYNGTFGNGAKANFAAAAYPSVTNGFNPTTFKVNGYSIVNNNDIVKAQAAYDFITYYCADEAYQTNYCIRNSKLPALKTAQKSDSFKNDNMNVFIDTLENAECVPSAVGMYIIKEYIADAVLSVINDNVPVSDALAKAAQKANNRLGRN